MGSRTKYFFDNLLGADIGLNKFWVGFRNNSLILGALASVFIIRLFLSNKNSYWNDELLSVAVYGVWNESALDAITALGESSIHPPLYQYILYNWMLVFGNEEVATRSLSNLYISLAAFFLYLTVKESWGRATAFFSSLGFSVMGIPVYYAMESRSYAQTIFLVTLSSWLVWKLIIKLRNSGNWVIRGNTGQIGLIVLVNSAISLTHYYNFFWLIAQALFVLTFALVEAPELKKVRTFLFVGALAVFTPLVFVAVWGSTLLRQISANVSQYEVSRGEIAMPYDLLVGAILKPNIGEASLIIWVLSIGLFLSLGLKVSDVIKTRSKYDSKRVWSLLYFASWLLLPLTIVSFVFFSLGIQRISNRYFLFSVPPLTALIMISISVIFWRVFRNSKSQIASVSVGSLSVALVFSLLLPSGVDASSHTKVDWRGNVERVVNLVTNAPQKDFYILDTGFRKRSLANYYFERFSENVRVDLVATRKDERNNSLERLDSNLPPPGDGRQIILVFNHLRTSQYPNLFNYLESRYTLVHSSLDNQGRGYIVFDTSSN
jgi:uncharacterized membrane protein